MTSLEEAFKDPTKHCELIMSAILLLRKAELIEMVKDGELDADFLDSAAFYKMDMLLKSLIYKSKDKK